MSVSLRIGGGLKDWFALIRFSHSIFALPFALISLLVATGGRPGVRTLLLVVLAMVCARSAAMAYNRFADRDLDAANPRTREREIPRGAIRARAALGFALVCSAAFVATARLLNTACFWLSLPTLAVLLGYSHAKRFTSLSHVWLGIALGLASPAAWIAARGAFDASFVASVVLGLGVTAWVAGFDVVYACQDEAFDRSRGLHSLPARLGAARALVVARLLHAVAIVGFAGFGAWTGLGVAYFLGVAATALLLAFEHRLVRPGELGRVDMAFFTMNGVVGLAMLAFTAIDLYLA